MDDSELPSYGEVLAAPQAHGQLEHSYALEINSHKWLSLFVKSRASSPKSQPMFLQGDVIVGRVELHLEKAETVKGIMIAIEAGTTVVGQEEFKFLDEKQTLWAPGLDGVKNTPKLKGRYTWPFRLILPSMIPVMGAKGKEKKTYNLPPYFSERAGPVYIDYRLVVTVRRGPLRVNQTLTTIFGYQPVTIPEAPSQLRQLAYKQGTPILVPGEDPDGWKVLPVVHVKGTLFEVKRVEVKCTLAIALPLTYAVGSPMPLILTLKSPDTQALDVLSAPNAIRLHLIRSMTTGSDATDEGMTRRTDNYFLEGVGQAYFWTSSEQDGNKRVLQGELEISRNLKPSFVFPRFTIQYHLELLPFKAPGFVSAIMEGDVALLTEKVTIATMQTPGITPRSRAPPGYERPQQVDYNKSVGFLENGNQRFYHHTGHG
ncbi:hypothetical protein BDZ94DRAFT_1212834 [Collybia nuda]|uniref:Arrestin-like N-terminal domain-containing protein n=1 Tax=Collybia nuda TaxID=64659 RepID=A0A9P6CNG9_9AGAR|nr:hypothetical protein BDZ94DRAFT_1212834 [Collybia nuda]